MARGAAFFDLDRTLMEGSSAFQFGARRLSRRACWAAGSCSPTRCANIRFRLRGATDEDTRALRDRDLGVAAGRPRARPRAARRRRAGRGSCRGSIRRCSRSPTSTRTPGGPCYIVTAASQTWPRCWPSCSRSTARSARSSRGSVDGVYTGRPTGAVHLRRGQGARDRGAGAARAHRPDGSYAYSDSVSDLPMLRAVGHPVAVNPDAALPRSRARRAGRCCASSGWPAAEGAVALAGAAAAVASGAPR